MNKLKHSKTLLFLFVGFFANAQTIVWTGAASDNNFFTEGNWKDSVTNVVPASNTINPGTNISLALQINIPATITASGSIQFSTGSLALGSATVSATSLSGGNVTINEGGYLNLSSASPLLNNVQINFTSGIGWLRTTDYTATDISNNNLGQLKVNGSAAVYQTNLRLDHYYLNGCVIRANLSTSSPLTVYDGINKLGNSAGITVNTIHSGNAITGSMNNRIKSFVLKKGFMATFAIEEDGTGKSKNYIASEADLVINILPKTLLNTISFIRVMPWNWVTKKGRTGAGTDLNTSWRYQWSNSGNSTLDTEYAPMAWGGTAADDANDIALYIGKYNSTHVMAFNESDNCNGQSGVYGNPKLCVIDEAVRLYKNLMKTGMRLVSPSGTEGAATTWLKDFRDKANEQDVRIDVIGVHWYDWGSNPATNTNPTATQVFNRFKTYLTNVYNLYGLPIWITEFNANPYRSTAIQQGFMELALPYLETLSYVERYNWFQPNPTPLDPDDNETNVGTGEFYTTRPPGAAVLTTIGTTYKNQVSTPAIPETTLDENNNLNLVNCNCE
jgi:Glycosyl hydrolase catalytic core